MRLALTLVVGLVAAGCTTGYSELGSCAGVHDVVPRSPPLPVDFLQAPSSELDTSADAWFGLFMADVAKGNVVAESRGWMGNYGDAQDVRYVQPLNASQPGFYRVGGPGLTGSSEVEVRVENASGTCRGQWMTVFPLVDRNVDREVAAAGQGVLAYTAGFLDNGTMFYTNIAELDASDWPRVDWYEWEDGNPLPVYVYNRDRSEQPAYWKSLGSNYAGTGPAYNASVHENASTVDAALGLGYFTTIAGFNAALKGLSTDTTTVAVIEPQDGYTRVGYEEHPLYGERLVFLIKIIDVVDAPCPQGDLAGLCGFALS